MAYWQVLISIFPKSELVVKKLCRQIFSYKNFLIPSDNTKKGFLALSGSIKWEQWPEID